MCVIDYLDIANLNLWLLVATHIQDIGVPFKAHIGVILADVEDAVCMIQGL